MPSLIPVSPTGPPALLPLQDGQQYRFVFRMDSCIGCHSCEVACAEQNELPVDVTWRRVGVLEGGTYPDTTQFHLSLACNHCVEPLCLAGCPTGAYEKLSSGIVSHHAEDCIGCGYCAWTCPYDVPVLHPTRKIATKCDMCRPRLEAGLTSACVDACPTRAIDIEPFDVAAWRADPSAAAAPGLADPRLSVSTTRIEMSASAGAARDVDFDDVRAEHAHTPLIWLTLWAQLACALAVLACLVEQARPWWAAATGAWLCGLAGSVLHLGQPLRAWKALRNLATSWLSREIAAFGAATALAIAAAVVDMPAFGLVAAIVAMAAVLINAQVYRVVSRPAWDSPLTAVRFAGTSARFAGAIGLVFLHTNRAWCVAVSTGAAALLAGVERRNVGRLASRADRPAQASVALWRRVENGSVRWRDRSSFAAVAVSLVCLFDVDVSGPARVGALVLVVLTETIGRRLFFTTVAGSTMPGRWNGAWR
jgi:formate dehydrogenase iron-sulfur subunit